MFAKFRRIAIRATFFAANVSGKLYCIGRTIAEKSERVSKMQNFCGEIGALNQLGISRAKMRYEMMGSSERLSYALIMPAETAPAGPGPPS
jgi:hypothetical protein